MKMVHGITELEMDARLAKKYLRKIDNAKSRNIEFSLTFAQFKQVMLRKRCAYTGVPLTMHFNGNPEGDNVTLERVDETRGYVYDNCVAITCIANSVKSVFEDPSTPMSVNDAVRMFAAIDRLKKNQK